VGFPWGQSLVDELTRIDGYLNTLVHPNLVVAKVLEDSIGLLLKVWFKFILTTTDLIDKTDMIAVMPRSIADTYAQHGLLRVLPCEIRHKMESFGSITRKDRPLSEAARFFLGALHQRAPSGLADGV